jgi:hypothetical protein
MNKKIRLLSVVSSALIFLAAATAVDAGTILVKCEKRAGRSKISVDGKSLANGVWLKAQVISGAKLRTSPWKRTAGREVEFDFDSNANDIAEGATPIGAAFITGTRGPVTGKLVNRTGRTVMSDTVLCRAR